MDSSLTLLPVTKHCMITGHNAQYTNYNTLRLALNTIVNLQVQATLSSSHVHTSAEKFTTWYIIKGPLSSLSHLLANYYSSWASQGARNIEGDWILAKSGANQCHTKQHQEHELAALVIRMLVGASAVS